MERVCNLPNLPVFQQERGGAQPAPPPEWRVACLLEGAPAAGTRMEPDRIYSWLALHCPQGASPLPRKIVKGIFLCIHSLNIGWDTKVNAHMSKNQEP